MHTKKSRKADRKVGEGGSTLTVSLTVEYPFFTTPLLVLLSLLNNACNVSIVAKVITDMILVKNFARPQFH